MDQLSLRNFWCSGAYVDVAEGESVPASRVAPVVLDLHSSRVIALECFAGKPAAGDGRAARTTSSLILIRLLVNAVALRPTLKHSSKTQKKSFPGAPFEHLRSNEKSCRKNERFNTPIKQGAA